MRISPVGFAYDDIELVMKKAEEFTAITHNHTEGIKGGAVNSSSDLPCSNGSYQRRD